MIVNTDNIQDENKVEEWKSCCLKVDKNMVKYIVQPSWNIKWFNII